MGANWGGIGSGWRLIGGGACQGEEPQVVGGPMGATIRLVVCCSACHSNWLFQLFHRSGLLAFIYVDLFRLLSVLLF